MSILKRIKKNIQNFICTILATLEFCLIVLYFYKIATESLAFFVYSSKSDWENT
jgi:hypothetical protein